MKAIRIAALVAALLISSAAIASAQGAMQQQGGQGRRNMQLDGIELTDAQKSKLEEIQKKYQPEMMALRTEFQNGGDRAELMKKSVALRDRSSAEIRAILTADQQTVFDKHTAEMKARMEQAQRQP
jgi:Spy/CpxP family protein refolding chaperone